MLHLILENVSDRDPFSYTLLSFIMGEVWQRGEKRFGNLGRLLFFSFSKCSSQRAKNASYNLKKSAYFGLCIPEYENDALPDI